jgi:signal transduction histidine kinase/ligand-binding sensor domain-containing protein
MKLFLSTCIVICFLLPAINSSAQVKQVKFNAVTETNGVTLGKINSIVQDKYGFMWFADQDNQSIVRYDGNHMTRYPHDPGNPNSLGGIHPECLATDSLGNIWIGFFGMGLDKFDPITGLYTHFRNDSSNGSSLSNDVVSSVLVDHLGNVWVGTSGGLDLLDQKTGTFKHYRHNENDSASLSYNVVRALYEDRAGELWVGTGFFFNDKNDGGLNHFHRNSGTFTRYRSDPSNPQSLSDNRVRSIFEDSRGTFWIGTNVNGLHTMDRRTGLFTRLPYNPKYPEELSVLPAEFEEAHITFITEDANKKIWIGTWQNGLTRYDPLSRQIARYNSKVDKSGLLNIKTPWSAYATSDGLVWISTDGDNNLFKVDVFTTIIPHIDMDGVLTFNEEGDSVCWYGTRKGLVRKDVKNGNTRKFVHNPGDPNSISNNVVNTIIKDKQGDFWIGTEDGLNHLNLKTGKFTRYYHDLNQKSGNKVLSLYQDSKSYILIGTEGGGLDILNPQTGKITNYKLDATVKTSISSDIVSAIIEDEAKNLWIGTPNAGLNKLNPTSGKFTRCLGKQNIQCIYKDAVGIIWVGAQNGLYSYDNKSDSFTVVTIGDFDNGYVNILNITGDKEDNLWICAWIGFTNSARQRIYRLNKNRKHLIHFGKDDSIEDRRNFIFARSAFKRRDGELYFGNMYGYYAFYPEKLKTTSGNTPLYFTSFWLGNKEIKPGAGRPLKESLYNAKEIRLNHNENVFSISATFIDFGYTRDKNFFYQLENYDNDWRSAGAEDKIQYFKVPPGKYIFRIKIASSSNGEWIEKSIHVIILPPWWRTWWAYILYGLLLAVFALTVHRFQKQRYVQAERKKAEAIELAQAKEIEKAYNKLKSTQAQLIQSEKMASLGELTAGIAHEIQNPLNFVNNFSEVNNELLAEMKIEMDKGNLADAKAIANNVIDNGHKINHHGKRADAIVKGMLQHSQSGGGVKEPTDINALANEYLRLAYHGLKAKDKSFNVSMKTDFDQQIGAINIVPQDIGRVLLNLVNNAFYAVSAKAKELSIPKNDQIAKAVAVNEKKIVAPPGYEPTIWLQTKKVGDKVEISVRDNGDGVSEKIKEKIFQPFFTTKPTGQGTGLGLSLSYDIIKAHGGELRVVSREGEGSEFIIQLPV